MSRSLTRSPATTGLPLPTLAAWVVVFPPIPVCDLAGPSQAEAA